MGSNPIVASMKKFRGKLSLLVLCVCLFTTTRGQAFSVNFLENDAGISAFFEFQGPTNLASNLLRNQFRVIEMSTSSYLLGSIACHGVENDPLRDVKVFIHNDGWVVAFFPKNRPLAQIVDSPKDINDRLQQALAKIAFAIDIDSPTISYTHFQHPTANYLIRIGKYAHQQGEFSMDLRLPGVNSYKERSWHERIQNSLVQGWFVLDQVELGRTPYGFGSTTFVDGAIPEDKLVVNSKHVITIGLSNSSWGYSYGELDLVVEGSDSLIITGADWIQSIPLVASPDEMMESAKDVPFIREIFLPTISRLGRSID